MFLRRLLLLFSGYLVIHLRGERIERFVNLCLEQGIPIWDIYTTKNGTVVGKTDVTGFKHMRPAARRSGVRVRILRRRGLPFLLSRLWKRTAFACGALLFVCLLYLLGSVIWFVEVQGAEQVPMASIRRAAAELGLRPGVWRHRVSGNEIGRDLVVKVPELAWAGVELRGSCAIVQVVEKKIVLPQDEPLGNIVAAKNGIISKIIAVQGKSLVKVGDTVQKGDVLISGTVAVDEDVQIRYVHAKGIVQARVWYEGAAASAIQRWSQQRTGRSVQSDVLQVADKEITVIGPRQPGFALYEEDSQTIPIIWRTLGLAVEHKRKTFHELSEEYEVVSLEQARTEALEKAKAIALSQLPAEVEPVEMTIVSELAADQNSVWVQVVLETEEHIGLFVPMQEPEP